MPGIVSQQVAGFWWRYQIVPLCPSCTNELLYTESSNEAGIQFTCQSCGINVFRAVPQHALSQALLELASQHEEELAKAPPKQHLRVDAPVSNSQLHINPILKVAELHRTIIPNPNAHSD